MKLAKKHLLKDIFWSLHFFNDLSYIKLEYEVPCQMQEW